MKNTSNKVLPIFACGAIIICSVIRFFQYVSIMDFDTGFYLKGSEPAGNLIYAVMILCSLVFIALAVAGKKFHDAAFTLSSDGMGDHATQFLGTSMLAGAFFVLLNAFNNEGTAAGVASFVAAAVFLAAGFVLLKNIVPPVYSGFLFALAAVYVFIRTCKFFNSDLVILNHSDSLLTLIAYVLFTAFLASAARFYSRFETKHSRMREIITTGAAFIFCGVHVISKLLAFAFGGTTVTNMSGINTDITAGAVISGTFLFVLFFTKKSKDMVIVVEEPDKKKDKKNKERSAETENAEADV